ncbi:MAG: hypothetical protein A2Y77_18365 [Planctomycetes bacterium RBG_13_62_9]|nr:MAG: hypothetical protein A2Y77_18365 [Planctomycetes bacterium RBG_13_62_9]
MRLEKRQPSGREKDEEALKLLEQLREQLYSSNISTIRQSAFHLSWMQEDGLDILKEALLGDTPRRSKGAAAYGLRKMRGRMRKQAEEVLMEGTKHPDPATAETCRNALAVLKKIKLPGKRPFRPKGRGPRFEIKEIPGQDQYKRQPQRPRRPDDRSSPRRR